MSEDYAADEAALIPSGNVLRLSLTPARHGAGFDGRKPGPTSLLFTGAHADGHVGNGATTSEPPPEEEQAFLPLAYCAYSLSTAILWQLFSWLGQGDALYLDPIDFRKMAYKAVSLPGLFGGSSDAYSAHHSEHGAALAVTRALCTVNAVNVLCLALVGFATRFTSFEQRRIFLLIGFPVKITLLLTAICESSGVLAWEELHLFAGSSFPAILTGVLYAIAGFGALAGLVNLWFLARRHEEAYYPSQRGEDRDAPNRSFARMGSLYCFGLVLATHPVVYAIVALFWTNSRADIVRFFDDHSSPNATFLAVFVLLTFLSEAARSPPGYRRALSSTLFGHIFPNSSGVSTIGAIVLVSLLFLCIVLVGVRHVITLASPFVDASAFYEPVDGRRVRSSLSADPSAQQAFSNVSFSTAVLLFCAYISSTLQYGSSQHRAHPIRGSSFQRVPLSI